MVGRGRIGDGQGHDGPALRLGDDKLNHPNVQSPRGCAALGSEVAAIDHNGNARSSVD